MTDLWRIALIVAIDIAGVVLYIRARPVLRMSRGWQLLSHITSVCGGLLLGLEGGAIYGWWYFAPLVVLITMLGLWLYAWEWLQRVALSARADQMLAKQRTRNKGKSRGREE
jgi:uncharacterized membrane protein